MNDKTQRIERKTSRTAEMICLSRAASFYEREPHYKSDDYIAPKLVPKFMQPFLRSWLTRKFYKNIMAPKGIYEYVIARTKFIDSVFKNAIAREFSQILIFGAGFDSRGMRFLDKNSQIKVFELDAPITQNAKLDQLKRRGIKINPNIICIPIDFNKESIGSKLIEAGFKKNRKSLFILEGLTMYLTNEAVNSTFKLIEDFSGVGSEIVFDYIYASVLRRENVYYGEKGIFDTVMKANEAWSFGIESGQIEAFLKNYNFRLIENNNSEDLENKYFRNRNGDNKLIGRVNGTHCIAYAKKNSGA